MTSWSQWLARSDSENMIESVLDGVVDTAVQDSRVKAIMAEIKEYSLERVIIVEIEKERNSVTRSNRFSNESEVMTGQSNGSPSNALVMGCSWGQDEHPILKMIHEEVDGNGGKRSKLEENDMDNKWRQEYDWL